ncbi:protein PTST homolog 3, chloroplastic isoform X2 [Cornus florida]|uniref:protein PTST homolog 3, chloroplastic isoform X2 n=1 Tax=Cornus florida TaxID=4283 RepID=UPI0028A0A1E3|nr:protein PTST homolog 3, chloroplastic isoform X2 [Cornus florida]
MATLSHFPGCFFLSSHKHFSFPLPSLNVRHYHCPLRLTISASSISKPRASKKVRSDAELCSDIRQFLSAVGLPEDHVPSMKELSHHGRQDLANIVRRRGYKLIRKLLSASTRTDSNGSDVVEVAEKPDATSDCGDQPTGQDEKVEDMAEDVSLSSEVSATSNYIKNGNGANIDHPLNSDGKSCTSLEISTNTSLQEKVAKFIQNGELDIVEDNGFGILNETGAEEGFIESENVTEFKSSSLGEEHPHHVLGRNDAAKILKGSTLMSSRMMPPASGNRTLKDGHFSSEELLVAENDDNLEARKRENQVEINHLKFMLHQKELELSRLKEQIEKEKLALSILQTKAETEISKAQKLILEKDSELIATEESLSGLEEVKIQYWGEGETVEVAGSFNGWHHQIKMDPQPSSSILDSIGSSYARKSGLWTTVLWLYPGTYEIKFIVDGHWKIDPQRESITMGSIQNNILRVVR